MFPLVYEQILLRFGNKLEVLCPNNGDIEGCCFSL